MRLPPKTQRRNRGGKYGWFGCFFVLGGRSNDCVVIVVGKWKESREVLLLPPGEAAKIAADRRLGEWKKRDEKLCLPCNKVIEILEGDFDEAEENGVGGSMNEVN